MNECIREQEFDLGRSQQTTNAKLSVLVHLGHNNKIPKTEGAPNNRKVFLAVLGARKSKITVSAWLHSGEGPPPGPQPVTSCCVVSHLSGYLLKEH